MAVLDISLAHAQIISVTYVVIGLHKGMYAAQVVYEGVCIHV